MRGKETTDWVDYSSGWGASVPPVILCFVMKAVMVRHAFSFPVKP